MKPKKIYFLVGPTAVGKTELSLCWAEQHRAEILSCDSVLCYQGMAIGADRPSQTALQRVPHHGLDLSPVSQQVSVKAYQNVAQKAIGTILGRGRKVLVVGGSGFYLKGFFAPVTDDLFISQAVRDEVQQLYERERLVGVLNRLRSLNPAGLGTLDTHNPKRVLKAFERCLASGQTLQVLQSRFTALRTPFSDFEKNVCLLTRTRSQLRERITQRARNMLAAGLVEEVRQLLKQGILENPSATRAIGYRETIACLQGEAAFQELEAAIIDSTMALVRKQDTWFRKQIPLNCVVNLTTLKPKEPPIIFRGIYH